MPEKNNPKNGFSRRHFLKTATLIGCSALASNLSCSPKVIEKNMTGDHPESLKGRFEPMPSPWFKETARDNLQCTLCPKACELEDGDRGVCKVRENKKGEGFTLAYGNPALVQEDPIERKPFYHVHPASRVLSICTVGCNLQCKFCEVWDIALVSPEDVHVFDLPPEAAIDHARSSHVKAISYAFAEPVVFYEYMSDIATLAKNAGLLNLIHTAGYIQPEPLRLLCGKVDAANVDLKSFDQDFYNTVVGGELEPVLNTIKTLHRAGVHLEITNLIIPTLNDDMDKIREMCTWLVDELGPDVPLHFSRFYPLYQLSALPRTPVSTLDQARSIAMEAGLNYVYIAKVIGHEGENTLCPACGETLIKRLGFVVEDNRIEDGRCGFCQAPIPGLWA